MNNNNNNYNLFNKVFKNQFLFNKIFSYVNSSFKYLKLKNEQLISVIAMIEMEQYELVRYKVINNEYITFGNTLISNKPDNSEIFKADDGSIILSIENERRIIPFKNLDTFAKELIYSNYNKLEDQYFYQCLFKNYNHYFINEFSNDVKKKEEFINTLIKCDCLGGLLALVNHFKLFEINESHILLSFKLNSFKIAEYIYSNFNFKNTKSYFKKTSIDELWSILKNSIPTTKEYLIGGNKLDKPKTFKELECKIQFLIKVVKVNKSDTTKHLKDISYSIGSSITHLTIKELIQSCITISFLEIQLIPFVKNCFNNYKEYIKQMKCKHSWFSNELINIHLNEIYNFKENIILSIEEIKEIERLIPSNQLSVNLMDLNCKFNSLIKPLIKMVVPFIDNPMKDYSSFAFYFIRFLVGSLDNIPKEFKFNLHTFDYLLEYSQDTSECKINFIKSSGVLNSSEDYFYFYSTTKLFIIQNDVKCLQFIMNTESRRNMYLPFSDIKSLEMFQYLDKTMHQTFAKKDLLLGLDHSSAFHQFFKSNYPEEFNQLIADQISFIQSRFHSTSIPQVFAKFIYDNISFFIKNRNVLDTVIPNEINIGNLSLPQIQLFFQISNNDYIQRFNLFSPSSSLLPNCYIQFTSNEKFLLFYYYNNQITEYLNDNDNEKQLFFFQNSSLLFSIMGKNGDENILTYILLNSVFSKTITTNGINNEKYIDYLNPLLLYASFFGQLQIFKLIIDKYPHLFIKHSNILKICKRYSTINNHLLLTDLLNKL